MKKKMIATFLLCPLAYTMVNASLFSNKDEPEVCAPCACPTAVHSDKVYFKHIEGKGVGYKEGYSTIGAFLTPYSSISHVVPFLDVRGHVFNRHWNFAANAGAGIKWMTDSALVAALGAYYDYRQTSWSHYNQVGLSFELLEKWWEVRLNGYLPVGHKTASRKSSQVASYNFEKFAGHNLYYSTTYNIRKKIEFVMKGIDGEVGFHLMEPQEDYSVYLGLGPYYFHSPSGLGRHAFGGQVRCEARITPYLTLQISNSYDNLFKNNFQGEISINVPFGGRIKKSTYRSNVTCDEILAMEFRMIQPMHRNEIIVADKKRLRYTKTVDPIAQSIYGGPLYFNFVNAKASTNGDGTFEKPYNDIYYASTQSSPNDVLYISGNFTLSSIVDQQIVLQENQNLLGSGITQTVPIKVGTTIVNLAIPAMTSTMPSITQGVVDNLLFVNGSNTVISGIKFNLLQGNTSVITNIIPGTSNYYQINNLTVANSNLAVIAAGGAYGIYLRAVTGDVIIQNNTINSNPNMSGGQNGIYIEQIGLSGGPGSYSANVSILGNTLQYWDGGGLNGPILLQTNIDSNQNTQAGNSVLNVLVMNNNSNENTYYPAGGYWLYAGGNSTINATVLNNAAQNNDYGMVFQAQDSAIINVAASGNNCSNNPVSSGTGGIGMYVAAVNSASANVIFSNNTVNNNGTNGIVIAPSLAWGSGSGQNGASVTAVINDNQIESNGQAGVVFQPQFSGPASSQLTFENNTLIGNGNTNNYSFYIGNGNASTMTLFMNGNSCDSTGFGVQNFNSSPFTLNLVEPGLNSGAFTIVGGGPVNIVE